MSTVFSDISAALDSQLNTLTGSSPVAWENTVYKPIKNTLYLRPTHLPAPTVQAGLGTTGIDEYLGLYQIDVFAPAGTGRGIAEAKADVIANHFKRGTDLLYNGVYVRLGNVSRNAGLIDEDRFVISVTINYTAHVAPR
jgi:hypothetical protein|tara:strand:- start:703 stop:1119 length:417 start_codon:yes stop_codon:yes gene_type:complete